MVPITTQRLLLRAFRPEDGPELYEYLSQEEVVRYEPYGVFSLEDSLAESRRRAGDPAFIAVCQRESGKLIGNLYFQRQQPAEYRTWELGYVFSGNVQGQGYAAEACAALLRHAFTQLEVRRVTAHCNPENKASWRLLERLRLRREGFSRETGYFKTDAAGQPKWHDTYAYGVLAREWLEQDRPME